MSGTGASLLPSPESIRLGAAFLVGAALLFVAAREARRHVARLVLLWGASVLLRLVAGLSAAHLPSAAPTISFLALLLQGIAFVGLAAVLLFDLLLPLAKLPVPRIVRDVAVSLSWVALLLWLFSVHQVDVTGIVATSAVVTAVIGFSLQDTLANVMGGIALQLERAFGPGDWVRFGDTSGRVRETSWRHTSIETRNGDVLLVPNSILAKTPLLLLGTGGGRTAPLQRRWIFFGVDHRTPPTTVLETVREALTREPIPNVACEPAPSVVLMEFRDSWASYAARYWLSDLLLDDPTDSEVRVRVAFALRRAGIALSMPASANFVTVEEEGHRKQHGKRDLEARLAALESVPLFAALTAEERERLAPGLVRAPFAPGEAMVVQGRQVHDVYILTKGAGDVRIAVDDAPPRVVSRIAAPDVFGEMGMLTGEPRRATVVAVGETECWRLGKERFREVLESRPELAAELARVLAARQVELATAREGISDDSRRHRIETEHGSLRARIERFFGLGARGGEGERNGR
ncbi:MAG: cyclic nucleotide-binding domain-containing protein [Thermoanaerobaculia bacterium]